MNKVVVCGKGGVKGGEQGGNWVHVFNCVVKEDCAFRKGHGGII